MWGSVVVVESGSATGEIVVQINHKGQETGLAVVAIERAVVMDLKGLPYIIALVAEALV